MARYKGRRPIPVERAMRDIGENVATWRKLRRLTVTEVAERANIGESTLTRLEHGQGATMENLLRVARALGVMDALVSALDPYNTDVGRLRADETLPTRVRRRKS